jgi:hypothetical protein
MTIIGITMPTPEKALVWADTMTFVAGAPHGHVAKLIVNPTARIIGTGCGWGNLQDRLAIAVTLAISLDDLIETLPGKLRRESASIADRRLDPASFIENTCIVVGLSKRFGRLVGYVLEAAAYFEPHLVSNFCAPHSDELAPMAAQTLDDVRGLAQQQIFDLRRSMGFAISGEVIAAVLTPDGCTTETLLHLNQRPTTEERPCQ